MQSTQSTQPETTPREASSSRFGSGKRRIWSGVLLTILVVLGLTGWQVWSIQSTSTDPRVAGRPLSNPEMHLHTLALGEKPGVVYLGTHFGLFTSADGGRTWPEPRGQLSTLMITSISVNPADASTLAVVGEPSGNKAAQGGIYFSSDSGQSWSLRAPENLPATAYPFTIHAGTGGAGHFYAFYLYAGWFETHDLGLHWRPITQGALSDMQAPALLTLLQDPNFLLLGGEQGVFETKDDGQHWQQLSTINGSVLSLAASQQAPVRIFCATDQGLYSWTEGKSTPTLVPLPDNAHFSRLISDMHGELLYGLSGRTLWSSEDAGQHWHQRSQFDRGDVIALQMVPQHPEQLYAGFFLPPKVLASRNGGSTWQVVTSQ